MPLREFLDGDSNTFRSMARMDKPTFQRLVDISKTYDDLLDSDSISAEKMVLIFIVVPLGKSNRDQRDLWQHSGSTISVTRQPGRLPYRSPTRLQYRCRMGTGKTRDNFTDRRSSCDCHAPGDIGYTRPEDKG